MPPFSLVEITNVKLQSEHWFRGGFPDALLAPNATLSAMWIENFIETFLHRDIRLIGFDIPIPTLELLLKGIASTSENILNVDSLSNTLGINTITVKKYLDILEGSFLLRRLQPYYVNTTKRLVRSPKVYIRDTGLLHRLISIRDLEQLQGSAWLGHSWETYVIEQIARVGGKSFEYSFYRTQAGAEVDLVLKGATGKITMLEIKYSSNAAPSKGFYSAVEDIKPDFQYVIVPEGDMWERNASIKVCGLLWFLTHEMEKL